MPLIAFSAVLQISLAVQDDSLASDGLLGVRQQARVVLERASEFFATERRLGQLLERFEPPATGHVDLGLELTSRQPGLHP